MNIKELKKQFEEDLNRAESKSDLTSLKVKYLGKKGELTKLLKGLSILSVEKRKEVGAEANKLKAEIEELINVKLNDLLNKSKKKSIDITEPGMKYPYGHLHPMTQFIRKSLGVFQSMGFEVYESPEVDTAYYNFDSLNVPKDHPARDSFDTFYIEDGRNISDDKKLLLRTHTTNADVRFMEGKKPPVRVVTPGKCYRNDTIDASHEATFHQLDGLVIDEGITVTDLLGTLRHFAKKIFGDDVKTRARPHYYPFTEPSIDLDISCILCRGKGCPVCKQSGWLEVMPCGMVNSTVLKNMGVNPTKYSGFAFGFGIERLMMLYHGVDDIRLGYSGDLRFLEQF